MYFREVNSGSGSTSKVIGVYICPIYRCALKLEFHDADTDTDILSRILARK